MATAALLTLAVGAPLAAQDVTLRGRAVDPAGIPMAGIEVLLHRVAGGSGASVAVDTTDAAGVFALTTSDQAADSAVYFAASRQDGNLYIGPFVRAPFDGGASYSLVVGGQPFSMGTPPTADPAVPAATPPSRPRSWLFALAPLVALIAVAGIAARRAVRPSTERSMLIRLAVLDEEADGSEMDAATRRERERIIERLTSD
jgi:hypothetical protein